MNPAAKSVPLTRPVPAKEPAVVGKRLPALDARDKATGRAEFVSDIRLPGMLWAKVLRSPVAHARIRNIDVSRALKLGGVKMVLTGKDCPPHKYGVVIRDETILAVDKVRYAGDEIAIVLATDPDIAEEALELIAVDYEELPVLLDPREAMEEGAPLIHEGKSNVAVRLHIERGEVDRAFAESDVVLEDTYNTSMVYQAYLEPMAAVAAVDASGRLTLWAGLQNPSAARLTFADALGIPADKLRIIQPHFGGGFGAKLEHKVPLLCAFAALKSGRPVRLVNDREEDFQAGHPRVPMTIRLKLGAKKDGTLTAKQVEIIADNGAYTVYAPGILSTALYRIDLLYRIANVRADGVLVYTNKAPTSAFRGFGNAQMHFAFECHLDALAKELGLDPKELRLKNAAYPGYVNPHGWKVGSCGLKECIEKATAAIGWEEKKANKQPRRGVGMACCMHVSGNRSFKKEFDGSAALVRVDDGGNVFVYSGEADLGQGARTVFAQIAAEELGVPYEKVKVAIVDTDIAPFAWGTFASRATYLGGNAVRAAAADAKRQILEFAAELLNVPVGLLNIQNGRIVGPSEKKSLDLAEVTREYMYRHAGANIIGRGSFVPEGVEYPDETKYGNISGAYPFAAQAAEVEVDTETGQVKVLRLAAAHDLGKAINPMLAEGQIEGGVAMGLGWALTENLTYGPDGRVANPQFLDYQIPTAMDVPPLEVILVEPEEKSGPYGAKSLGEPALIPTSPAIANAVYDAIGVRIKELPITPEKILAALKEKEVAGR